MRGFLDCVLLYNCCCRQVLVCPDKKRPEENKDKASLGYDEQVRQHCQAAAQVQLGWMHQQGQSCLVHAAC
jgi:hypothetical protein